MARTSKRELAARALGWSGFGAALRRFGAWHGLIVLAYHRIGDGSYAETDRGVWSASAEAFAAQLRCLKQSTDVITTADIPDVLRRQRGRFSLITFDDGYRDNYEVAFPILRAERLTALFFVTTGFLDDRRPAWWDEIAWMIRHSPRTGLSASPWLPEGIRFDEPDREQAIGKALHLYKSLPGNKTADFLEHLAEATRSGRCPKSISESLWMTWDMVRAMQSAGMSLGGHTVNHPVLARLNPEQQQAEIDGCAERLRAELNISMRWFSYPNGKRGCFNVDTRDALRRRGVEFGFSYYGGVQKLGRSDELDIPRFGVDGDLTLDAFRAALALPKVFAR
jgi:peptidoglycan/xylan/chitin deacetylase (PgdA/CDA1 family)